MTDIRPSLKYAWAKYLLVVMNKSFYIQIIVKADTFNQQVNTKTSMRKIIKWKCLKKIIADNFAPFSFGSNIDRILSDNTDFVVTQSK